MNQSDREMQEQNDPQEHAVNEIEAGTPPAERDTEMNLDPTSGSDVEMRRDAVPDGG
jgi:hypothetical protein